MLFIMLIHYICYRQQKFTKFYGIVRKVNLVVVGWYNHNISFKDIYFEIYIYKLKEGK